MRMAMAEYIALSIFFKHLGKNGDLFTSQALWKILKKFILDRIVFELGLGHIGNYRIKKAAK